MELLSVTCSKCGAPLETPQEARYITCAFCGARLEVKREGNVIYATLLEEMAARTEALERDVETLHLQNELERLDREWSMQRESLLVQQKDGRRVEPSSTAATVGAAIAACFGVVFTMIALAMGAPCFFALFGVVFVIFAVFAGVTGRSKALHYAAAHREYQPRRQAFLQRIQSRVSQP